MFKSLKPVLTNDRESHKEKQTEKEKNYEKKYENKETYCFCTLHLHDVRGRNDSRGAGKGIRDQNDVNGPGHYCMAHRASCNGRPDQGEDRRTCGYSVLRKRGNACLR